MAEVEAGLIDHLKSDFADALIEIRTIERVLAGLEQQKSRHANQIKALSGLCDDGDDSNPNRASWDDLKDSYGIWGQKDKFYASIMSKRLAEIREREAKFRTGICHAYRNFNAATEDDIARIIADIEKRVISGMKRRDEVDQVMDGSANLDICGGQSPSPGHVVIPDPEAHIRTGSVGSQTRPLPGVVRTGSGSSGNLKSKRPARLSPAGPGGAGSAILPVTPTAAGSGSGSGSHNGNGNGSGNGSAKGAGAGQMSPGGAARSGSSSPGLPAISRPNASQTIKLTGSGLPSRTSSGPSKTSPSSLPRQVPRSTRRG